MPLILIVSINLFCPVFLSLQDFENWYQCLGTKDCRAGGVPVHLGNMCLQLTMSSAPVSCSFHQLVALITSILFYSVAQVAVCSLLLLLLLLSLLLA